MQDVNKPSYLATSNATKWNVDNSDLSFPTEAIPIREEEFVIPKDHIRRQHCRERKNIVHGTGQGASSNVRGAPEPSRFLFIYRVDSSTDTDDLHDHITDHGITVRALECVSRPGSRFYSYRLTVPMSHFKLLFEPSLWPKGIRVRKFIQNHKNDQAKEISTQGGDSAKCH